jgi:hypothetical protein
MKEVGRPSQLDDEQFLLKIRDLVIENRTEKEITEILDIPVGTWDYWKWKNYQGFSDKLLAYKHERMIKKAEANLEVLQESEDERVNLQANTFVLETLSKNKYSKKTELDGKVKLEIQPITGMKIIKEDESNNP